MGWINNYWRRLKDFLCPPLSDQRRNELSAITGKVVDHHMYEEIYKSSPLLKKLMKNQKRGNE